MAMYAKVRRMRLRDGLAISEIARARLTDGPAPPSVTTALTVTTAPLADPHRYDRLHEEEATHG